MEGPIFSIFPDDGLKQSSPIGMKSVLSNRPAQKGFAPAPKKKALGDVGNTLQAKRVGEPSKGKPEIEIAASNKEIFKEHANKISPSSVGCDDTPWDVCPSCTSQKANHADDYADILPFTDRLTDDDYLHLIRGIIGAQDLPAPSFPEDVFEPFPSDLDLSERALWEPFDTDYPEPELLGTVRETLFE